MPLDPSVLIPVLPVFLCHKLVQGAKILRISEDPSAGVITLWFVPPAPTPAKPGDAVIVTLEWADKHHPQPGGYYVRYEDGYESYSPPAAFEAGYRPIPEPAQARAGGSYPLENNFTYHPPFGTQTDRYTFLREQAKKLAEAFVWCAPSSRELSLALTHLEQAVMWANAAISRNEKAKPSEGSDGAAG